MTERSSSFERILVGVDFSDTADEVLRVARSRFPGAELRVVHVVDARAVGVPDLSSGSLMPVTPGRDLTDALSHADFARLTPLLQDHEQGDILVGDPATALVEDAARSGADLIVVGAHNRGALERFFVGSVAEQVVRRAHVPVLVVKH
ncbi:universal stress protein [Deinococcus maricopensis]|uniref:UspA domain-containing protein n=1 Tax=Deinococcus maricopensis (strain DSM 21211 / LMG 22137 / NRRL B-23946 / LB-34) TaxID=709986 RepID=E8U4K1_DEIML|nr:universal stress protein [Deinococcus maricopensis]ADV68866.1 UspA domain-containing protein [Deinococcus maricopensis DSM 21211]